MGGAGDFLLGEAVLVFAPLEEPADLEAGRLLFFEEAVLEAGLFFARALGFLVEAMVQRGL